MFDPATDARASPSGGGASGIRTHGTDIRDPSIRAVECPGGGSGIRTHGTANTVQQFSRLSPSSTRPSLHAGRRPESGGSGIRTHEGG